MSTTLNQDSSAQDIHNWLASRGEENSDRYIHPKLISYQSKVIKKREIENLEKNPDNLDEERLQEIIEDRNKFDTVTYMLGAMKKSGCIF